MDQDCVPFQDGNTTVLNRHFWRGVAHLPANEYQFWCERCGKYYTIKKRIFWGLGQLPYLIAVVLKGKYQR